MNKQNNDNLWMASLDGELSAAEAAAFESALTDADRERMSKEMRLEQALGECLGGGEGCPDALWQRTQMLLRNQGAVAPKRRPRYWSWGLGAAAAVVLVAVFFFVPYEKAPADFLAMNAPSVAALADTSDVAAGEDAVNAFLAQHGVDLAVVDYREVQPKSMHAVRLLGVREAQVEGDSVLELLYDCCGRPAKVLIAPRGSAAADRFLEAKNSNESQLNWYDQDHSPGEGPYVTGLMGVQKTREVGKYVAGVVSVHPTEGLLDVLKHGGGAASALG